MTKQVSVEFKINKKKIDNLLRAVQENSYVDYGILSSKAARTLAKPGKNKLTNVLIGAVHEFGSPARKIPPRSFLREPIADHLTDRLETKNFLGEKAAQKIISQGTFKNFWELIGVEVKSIIKEAFHNGGFGKWKPSKEPNPTGLTLVETGELRDSVDYRVVVEK